MNVTDMSAMFELGEVDALTEIPKAHGETAKEFAQVNAQLKKVKFAKASEKLNQVDEHLDVKEQIAAIQERLFAQLL